jgi:hypothetical protein
MSDKNKTDMSIDLSEETEQAAALLSSLEAIRAIYEDLPEIDFGAETEQADKLLATLQAIRQEIETMPEGPAQPAGFLNYANEQIAEAKPVDIGPMWGTCAVCGREPEEILNVVKDHWAVCHTDKTRWWIGSNIFSSWQSEDESVWAKNAAILEGYRETPPDTPDIPKAADIVF